MNYKKFTVADFICDEYFQDWVIHPDEQKNKFWNKYMKLDCYVNLVTIAKQRLLLRYNMEVSTSILALNLDLLNH